jgi:hypothetical protein
VPVKTMAGFDPALTSGKLLGRPKRISFRTLPVAAGPDDGAVCGQDGRGFHFDPP